MYFSCMNVLICSSHVVQRSLCLGGSYRSWKKRYFVLKGNNLLYYANDKVIDGVSIPRGTIDLATGLGVRGKPQCKLEWPSEAKAGFGVATEGRTYYLYSADEAVVR